MGDPQSTAGVLYQIKSQTAQSTANIAKLQEAASHVSHLEQLPQSDQDPHIIVLRALVKQGSTLIGDLKHIQTELDQLLQEAERIETPAALLPTINKRIGQQNSLLEQLVELVENISELQKEIKEASTRKKRFPVDFLVTACYIVILVRFMTLKLKHVVNCGNPLKTCRITSLFEGATAPQLQSVNCSLYLWNLLSVRVRSMPSSS